MIRVLVVDDHAVVRRGVVQIVGEAAEMRCTGEAATGRDALRLAAENEYDVAVLDIHLPDGSGLDVLKQLRAFKPGLPVLILSMYPEQQYATRALKAGAAGYLTKESVPGELVAALRAVSRGERYVSRALAGALADQVAGAAGPEPHQALSDREDQVLRLLAAGKTVSQIAEELALSVKTVSTYRGRILAKLGLETTAALVRYALERGLVE
jgi:DNA-binding NarL/FixJ family response regulator